MKYPPAIHRAAHQRYRQVRAIRQAIEKLVADGAVYAVPQCWMKYVNGASE